MEECRGIHPVKDGKSWDDMILVSSILPPDKFRERHKEGHIVGILRKNQGVVEVKETYEVALDIMFASLIPGFFAFLGTVILYIGITGRPPGRRVH